MPEENNLHDSSQQQLLVFELDGEEFAAQITDLKEIVNMQEITPVPNSEEYIEGILNLRGSIVMVLNLEKKFNLHREGKCDPKHIIVAEKDDSIFGVIVDEVKGTVSVDAEKIQSPPSLINSKVHSDFIKGIVVIEPKKKQSKSRLLILIDLPSTLVAKDVEGIKHLTKNNPSPDVTK